MYSLSPAINQNKHVHYRYTTPCIYPIWIIPNFYAVPIGTLRLMTYISNGNWVKYFARHVQWIYHFWLSLCVYVSTKCAIFFNYGSYYHWLISYRLFNNNRFHFTPLEIYPYLISPSAASTSDSSLRNPWFKSVWRQSLLITENLIMNYNLYTY